MKTSILPALPAGPATFSPSSDSNDIDSVALLHPVDVVDVLTAAICSLGGNVSAAPEEIRREVALQLQHTANALARECGTPAPIEASGLRIPRVRPTRRRSNLREGQNDRRPPARPCRPEDHAGP